MKDNSNRFTLLVIVFYLLSILYLIKNIRIFSIIGLISILIIFISIFSVNLKQKLIFNKTILFGIIFALYNFIILIRSFNINSLYIFLQFLMLILFPLSFYQINIQYKDFLIISKRFEFIYYLIIVIFSLVLFLDAYDSYISIISKTTFKLVIPLSFFLFFSKKNYLLIFIYSILITFLLGERTVSLILVFLLVFNYKSTYRLSNKKMLIIGVILVLFSIFLPKVYISFSHMKYGLLLNDKIFYYTGENLFSGRNRLWESIIMHLTGNNILGLTFNNTVLNSMGTTLSTHNLFIWFRLCGGYVELLFGLLFLMSIYKDYVLIKNDKLQRLAISYFIAIIIMCSFDLLLFTNNLIISVFMWLVLMLPICIITNSKQGDTIE